MVTPRMQGGQRRWGVAIALLVTLYLGLCPSLAQAQADTAEAVRRCRELVPGFDEHPTNLRSQVQSGRMDQPVGVRLTWTRSESGTGPSEDWIICWFLPRTQTEGLWQIDLVQSQRF